MLMLRRLRAIRRLSPFFAIVLAIAATAPAAKADEAALWEALRDGGHVALLRHALAPGTGDPVDFTLGDCTTQRNLSDEGSAQARRIGQRFRDNGIEAARVYTSQWCRCVETAELLDLGPVSEQPAASNFVQDASQ